MSRRRNKFPGVSVVYDRHGKVRYRFRARGFSTYLHGEYGSPEFIREYEAARNGTRRAAQDANRPERGTINWLIWQYLRSERYRNCSEIRRATLRPQLDWIAENAGRYQMARFKTRHVEALMGRKEGPTAANAVKKNLSLLYNFAAKTLDYTGPNPARAAQARKQNPDGYHTWTDAEVSRFLERHGPGTKPRLVMLLALNTGMSRQDLCRVGRGNTRNGRIDYARGKTSVVADMPIVPDLAEELALVPQNRTLFVSQDRADVPYTPESLGNWFRARCQEAGVPGSLHGLRKAGATRLANAAASEWEIAAFLGHSDTKTAAVYTKKANRSRLTDSGFAKLTAQTVSNLS